MTKYKVMKKIKLTGKEYNKGDIIELISQIGDYYKSIGVLDRLIEEEKKEAPRGNQGAKNGKTKNKGDKKK